MKKFAHLLKIADKFQAKYAQSQTLQQIIESAAGYGEKSQNGIMNFPAQLKQDQADLSITVTVSSGLMGGRKAEVLEPRVDPPAVAGKYARLPEQIKRYLDRHLNDFPQIPEGTVTLSFSGKSDPDQYAQR
jgi:hypothetical protein